MYMPAPSPTMSRGNIVEWTKKVCGCTCKFEQHVYACPVAHNELRQHRGTKGCVHVYECARALKLQVHVTTRVHACLPPTLGQGKIVEGEHVGLTRTKYRASTITLEIK
jgi:hypothetical protein